METNIAVKRGNPEPEGRGKRKISRNFRFLYADGFMR
jgi:hypothetical protein